MGFLVGSIFGVTAMMIANGVQRLPLMHNPWNHGLAILIGGAAGMKFDLTLEQQKRAFRQREAYLGRIPKTE